jgi:putative phosphoribosyl transferase
MELSSSLVHLYKLSAPWIDAAQAKELKKAQALAALYAKIKPLEPLSGKTIILVDDGIATGATVFSTIKSLRQQGVKILIIASSVAAFAIWEKIVKLTNDAVCLATPEEFTGVSSFYEHFEPVEDETIIDLLKST